MQHLEQHVDVVEMQAGGRLIKNEQGLAGVTLGEFERKLHPLRLASGQRGRALSQADIAQADIEQGLQFARHHRHRLEKFECQLNRHVEHLGDVLAFVMHLQGFAVVAFAMANITRHIHIRQKMHFHFDDAVALARLAAPAFDIERKPSRPVAARARFGHRRKQIPYRREQSRVGGRIGARRAPYRRLIHRNHLVKMIHAQDGIKRRRVIG